LSFSRLVEDNISTRKTLILISDTMSLLGAHYGAGIMVVILSNVIYIAGMFIAVIVPASIFRVMLDYYRRFD